MKKVGFLKYVFAFLLLIPSIILFTACNQGEKIEKAEAYDALSRIVLPENLNSDNFVIDMNFKNITTNKEETSNLITNSEITYKAKYELKTNENNEKILKTTVNANMKTNSNNKYINGGLNSNYNIQYYTAFIDNDYYKFNTSNKEKEIISQSSFNNIGLNSLIGGLQNYLVSQEQIDYSVEQGWELTTDLRKLNDTSFNLTFELKKVDNDSVNNQKWSFEIRDDKITKIITQIEQNDENNNNKISTKYEFNIKYSSNNISIPTTIENYTEIQFPDVDLSDFN